MTYTLIANSGIHVTTFPLTINTQERNKMWFHEWYDTNSGKWVLDLVHELTTEEGITAFYKKKELFDNGYLNPSVEEISTAELKADGITPLKEEEDMLVRGDIYKMTFSDKDNRLSCFENVWMPIPYFFKRSPKKYKFGPKNWARFKLIPVGESEGQKNYNVVLAFDTRAKYHGDEYDECPIFPDEFRTSLDFNVCKNEFLMMDYCSAGEKWSYVNDYLLKLVHPDIQRVSQIKGNNVKRMSYVASYLLLINYIAQNELFPDVTLYKDENVQTKSVDMIVDIGNSRTTAILIEDNKNFNQCYKLQLTDYTTMLTEKRGKAEILRHNDPFDMRIAFRKVNFGLFGIHDSKQFTYPSLIRLGREANTLIHKATNGMDSADTLSTYSSPKRYLWDNKPSKEEWQFLVLDGEEDNHILNIPGISDLLRSDGTVDKEGNGGTSFHYSRSSLMTFAFLEMLVQAQTQINSHQYRKDRGNDCQPRKLKRIIVTCPTAMSKQERETLTRCAKDAVFLLEKFNQNEEPTEDQRRHQAQVEVIPAPRAKKDDDPKWYYDEATCSQLVYIYGEVGHKYKGCCEEFFNIYGKTVEGEDQQSLTIGSLDIGAGTSDLMINKYTFKKDDITTIIPDPLFYDSYYYAGDDMLNSLVKQVMFLSESSAFRRKLISMPSPEYRQKIKNFFGPDYNGQTIANRLLRRDFNMQYSVPLMSHYLELARIGSENCTVRYQDVFKDNEPNQHILKQFEETFGFDLTTTEWQYDKEQVGEIITKEFEPLLKKVATIMNAYSCDIVLLSGRPASLPSIRKIFLKYYTVSPNRLILLNNYYVGDWYPFGNNTGSITDPKTIVAMGAAIGYYASELSNLDKFIIDISKLGSKLKSVVNYIEASREGQPIEYFITETKNSGTVMLNSLPTYLNVRQIGMDSYPSRTLYSIDYDRNLIADRLRRRAFDNGETISDARLQGQVELEIEALRRRAPFKVDISRDVDDHETLTIENITDKDGNDIQTGNIEIQIQSLGVSDNYWLDTGAFKF